MRSLIKKIVDGLIGFECSLVKKAAPGRRVLVIRKDGLGDLVLFYPVLPYIFSFYKDYEIDLIIPAVAHELSPLFSETHQIIEYDAKKFSNNFFYRRAFIKNIVNGGYTTVIYPAFTREPIVDLIVKLTGARECVGVGNEESSIYTKLITSPKELTYEFDRNEHFASELLGHSVSFTFPTIDITRFDSTHAKALMKECGLISKKFCVIFTGAARNYRKWPEERYARICDELIERGLTPVVCGGPGDVISAGRIIAHAEHANQIVNLTGKTTLPDLAHILHNALIYIGNDTGALHLAMALNTPTVCMLGGGHFDRFFPYGDLKRNLAVFNEHMKCRNDAWECGTRLTGDDRAPCILGITTEKAIVAVDTLLQTLKV